MIRIFLEDIVGGAFDYVLNNTNETALSFGKLEKYGFKVIDILNKDGHNAYLVLSRDLTDIFFNEHKEMFKECRIDGEYGVEVIGENPINYIAGKIYGPISVNVLQALWSEDATSALIDFDKKKVRK